MPKPPPNVKPLKESIIQSNTIKAFAKDGWMCIKLIQTNCNGIPDIICLKQGKAVFVECKREGISEANPLQKYRHQQLRKQGFLVKIINEVNEVNEIKNVIESCNFLQK